MTELHVGRTVREARNAAPAAARAPRTTLANAAKIPTFNAPVSRPGGRWADDGKRDRVLPDSHQRVHAARSACGRWAYTRVEGGQWLVEFVPTGQRREAFGSLDAARQATYGENGLLLELRREAFTAALVELTAQGQRWLAVHMRLAGLVVAELRCECGGILTQVTRRGDLGHVDACRECLVDGQIGPGTRCEHAQAHNFCGTPTTVECGHHGDDRRYGVCDEPALPNDGAGCGRGGAGDCCGRCCHE